PGSRAGSDAGGTGVGMAEVRPAVQLPTPGCPRAQRGDHAGTRPHPRRPDALAELLPRLAITVTPDITFLRCDSGYRGGVYPVAGGRARATGTRSSRENVAGAIAAWVADLVRPAR